MSLHPKVRWTAVATALTTGVIGVLQAFGISVDPAATAGIVAVIGAVSGFLAPAGDVLPEPISGLAQDTVEAAPVALALAPLVAEVATVAGVPASRVASAVAPVQEAADIVSGVLSVVATFGAHAPTAPAPVVPAPVVPEAPAAPVAPEAPVVEAAQSLVSGLVPVALVNQVL